MKGTRRNDSDQLIIDLFYGETSTILTALLSARNHSAVRRRIRGVMQFRYRSARVDSRVRYFTKAVREIDWLQIRPVPSRFDGSRAAPFTVVEKKA